MTDDFSKMVTNYFKNDYRERGKIKWNGYFLSDHTARLNNDEKKRHTVNKRLPRMPLKEIKHQLQFATTNYLLTTVQTDTQHANGDMLPNITGLVSGFTDRGVVIDQQQILFEDIRAVVISDD
ncbi:hypothetical protein EFN63_01640 [Leuconostoc citreum]|uniref:hypothetical protein n=2 Tax=Leuconostoc citreum TaxID=33964 RepID=UPI001058C204|nr:hypothetical protein [Leuconostoc citreum]MCT3067074.1 hypothetical protein [Leuconostoc citreum]TDG65659.1 hypothetical protein C5L21_000862 [Leuconostoc citreum]GDZ85675.1 hypothetical protein LCTS_08740 [Leuconostoc citreum]